MSCQSQVDHADEIAGICISTFLGLPNSFHPAPRSNGTPQYCILAGIVLERPAEEICPTCSTGHAYYECVTVATGSKCLSESKLPLDGQALHDSHAEVLARRGFVRWLFEEIIRLQVDGYVSHWICSQPESLGGRRTFRIRDSVRVHLYVSTLPCGDASMLALSLSQDPEMAALKAHSSGSTFESSPETALRGRNGYDLRGAWRTKPGRADAEPTLSMSCSDKIAAWSLVGLQGALLSMVLEPVYIDSIVIGEVEPEMVEAISIECARAFTARLKDAPELLSPFSHHSPSVLFTNVPFRYSRSQVIVESKNNTMPLAAIESISWIQGSLCAEALVGGLKRGATAKSIKAHKASSKQGCHARYV
ncbi:hypothetical protein FRB94_012576 [Tulasnella sp. JGI-2019a]|nr:hypothetical protein FRB93_001461 [Tulasnella sp. JGI-2019a]KAG9009052.1 hypothetical protein FRB94_012576 [Tulasnella sp. JGI-2019a]KAG9030461.1 hypothetical protein FRB95_003910 [Tulasnella sp. JGI-2019a]